MLARARTCLGVQVWRRAAAMCHACLFDAHEGAVEGVGMDPPAAAADADAAVVLKVG